MTFNPGQTKQAQELAYSRKTNKNVPPPLWFNNAAVKKHITAWKKCPNTELFLVRVNLRKQPEYRKIRTRNNSAFGHFSRSDIGLQLDRKLLFNVRSNNKIRNGTKGIGLLLKLQPILPRRSLVNIY